MSVISIIRLRNFTLFVWLFAPVFIMLIPIIINITGLDDWGGFFLIMYMTICFVFGYKLEKSVCPNCNKYMFRGGQLKYALHKFLFKRCGQCGFELKK